MCKNQLSVLVKIESALCMCMVYIKVYRESVSTVTMKELELRSWRHSYFSTLTMSLVFCSRYSTEIGTSRFSERGPASRTWVPPHAADQPALIAVPQWWQVGIFFRSTLRKPSLSHWSIEGASTVPQSASFGSALGRPHIIRNFLQKNSHARRKALRVDILY